MNGYKSSADSDSWQTNVWIHIYSLTNIALFRSTLKEIKFILGSLLHKQHQLFKIMSF